MTITLATTWYPRGEFPRLMQFLPLLEEHYTHIVICCIPSDDPSIQEHFTTGVLSQDSHIHFYLNDQRHNGRILALKSALEVPAEFIHYVDLDRLLHWVETRPNEWLEMLEMVKKADCTIFGRSESAMLTHPQALINTEIISNRVVSHYLGTEMDVSAGSKAFSRRAAQYLVEHSTADNSFSTDAEWPILLKNAGYSLVNIPTDGLDYESADQFMPRAATPEEQRRAAEKYDANPAHWATRVDIADQIVKTALEINLMTHPTVSEDKSQKDEFDFAAVFDVEDYLYFYGELLTDERTDAEVRALVSMLELDAPKKILDLACGFGRHTNRLAALGHSLTGIDITPGFLEIARHDASQRQVRVTYQQGDMREIDFENEFDRVMLVFTAFGYFSDEINLQVLKNVAKALHPGGMLIFDAPSRDAFLRDMRPYLVMEKEGNLMIDRVSFDSLKGRIYTKRIVIRDGVRKDKPFFTRLYNPNEVRLLLSQAGLGLYHLYGGWDLKEYSSDSHRMVVVARKP